MFDITLDTNVPATLQATPREVAQIQRRVLANSIRNMRSIARRGVRARTGLRARSTNSRVLAFPGRGKLWLGARTVLLTSLQDVRVRPATDGRGRGRRVSRPNSVVIRSGQPVAGVFSPASGRLAGLPFRNVNGKLQAVRVDLSSEFEDAFSATVANGQAEINRVFAQQLGSLLRGRVA